MSFGRIAQQANDVSSQMLGDLAEPAGKHPFAGSCTNRGDHRVERGRIPGTRSFGSNRPASRKHHFLDLPHARNLTAGQFNVQVTEVDFEIV